jgi:TPR repeat protein
MSRKSKEGGFKQDTERSNNSAGGSRRRFMGSLALLPLGELLAQTSSDAPKCCQGSFQPNDLFVANSLTVDAQLARQGDMAATIRMGFAYYTGRAGRVDRERARSYFLVAARHSPAAAGWLGYLDAVAHKRPGAVIQKSTTFAGLQRAASAGDPVAQTLLGRVYERGLAGFRPNAGRAAELYSAAAPYFALAKTNLGKQLVRAGSYEKAIPFFRDAAAAGDTTAMVCLANLYSKRTRPPLKKAETSRLLKTASERGDRAAMYLLGMQYQKATWDSKGSPKRGFELVRRSAAMGYVPAQSALAAAYQQGTGIKADSDRGRFWSRKASMPDLAKPVPPRTAISRLAKTAG